MICVCFMMIKVCLPNWSFVWMKAVTSSCEYISMLCYLSSPFILGGYEVGTGGLSETQASCVAFSWTCVIYGFFCSDMSLRKILFYALQKLNASLHWYVPILISVTIFFHILYEKKILHIIYVISVACWKRCEVWICTKPAEFFKKILWNYMCTL